MVEAARITMQRGFQLPPHLKWRHCNIGMLHRLTSRPIFLRRDHIGAIQGGVAGPSKAQQTTLNATVWASCGLLMALRKRQGLVVGIGDNLTHSVAYCESSIYLPLPSYKKGPQRLSHIGGGLRAVCNAHV